MVYLWHSNTFHFFRMDVISDRSPQPGGRKNVELLNSVSRANYTMLTFRRSGNMSRQKS